MSNGGHYHVRIRGRVLGPFDLDALRTMVRRGKLARIHEVSDDGRAWFAAGDVVGLFDAQAPLEVVDTPPAPAPPAVLPAAPPPPAPDLSGRRDWFYTIAGREEGPVGLETLKELVSRGTLRPYDLVYGGGMTDWVLVRDVRQLDAASPTRVESGGRRGRAQPTVEVGPLQVSAGILLVLQGLFNAVIGCGLLIGGEFLSVLARQTGGSAGEAAAAGAAGALLIVIGLIALAGGILAFTAGVGLFFGRGWSVTAAMVVAIMGILGQVAGLAFVEGLIVPTLLGLAIHVFVLVVAVNSRPSRRRAQVGNPR